MPNDSDSTVDDEVECPKNLKKRTGISCNVSQCGDVGMVGKAILYGSLIFCFFCTSQGGFTTDEVLFLSLFIMGT
jgi:hypothetical protein